MIVSQKLRVLRHLSYMSFPPLLFAMLCLLVALEASGAVIHANDDLHLLRSNESDFMYQLRDSLTGLVPLWPSTVHYCEWTCVCCVDEWSSSIIADNCEQGTPIKGCWKPNGTTTFPPVRGLFLASLNLVGSFPGPALMNLKHVKQIDFDSNSLKGTMPQSFFSALPEIVEFSARYNSLSGALPPIPSTSILNRLVLRSNSFSGDLPTALCNSHMLAYLDLNGNDFSGKILECLDIKTPCTNWSHLDLGGNRQLSGTIPAELFICGANFHAIDLSFCSFEGELPEVYDVGSYGWLHTINFAQNNLQGTIPSSWSKITFAGKRKAVFSLAGNPLGGVVTGVPSGIEFAIFDLSDCEFEGPIPEELFSGLGVMDNVLLANNRFSSISRTFNESLLITELDVRNNNISGVFPASLVENVIMTTLRISGNPLTDISHITSTCGSYYFILDISNLPAAGEFPMQLFDRDCFPILNELYVSESNFVGKLNDIPKGSYNNFSVIDISFPSSQLEVNMTELLAINAGTLKAEGVRNVSCNVTELDFPSLDRIRYLSFRASNVEADISDLLKVPYIQSLDVSFSRVRGSLYDPAIFGSGDPDYFTSICRTNHSLLLIDISGTSISGNLFLIWVRFVLSGVQVVGASHCPSLGSSMPQLTPSDLEEIKTTCTNLRINSLVFQNSSMKGSVESSALEPLSGTLEQLDMSQNPELQGPLPLGFLSSAPRLRSFDVRGTSMEGPIGELAVFDSNVSITYNEDDTLFSCNSIAIRAGGTMSVGEAALHPLVSPKYFMYDGCVCSDSHRQNPPHCTDYSQGWVISIFLICLAAVVALVMTIGYIATCRTPYRDPLSREQPRAVDTDASSNGVLQVQHEFTKYRTRLRFRHEALINGYPDNVYELQLRSVLPFCPLQRRIVKELRNHRTQRIGTGIRDETEVLVYERLKRRRDSRSRSERRDEDMVPELKIDAMDCFLKYYGIECKEGGNVNRIVLQRCTSYSVEDVINTELEIKGPQGTLDPNAAGSIALRFGLLLISAMRVLCRVGYLSDDLEPQNVFVRVSPNACSAPMVPVLFDFHMMRTLNGSVPSGEILYHQRAAAGFIVLSLYRKLLYSGYTGGYTIRDQLFRNGWNKVGSIKNYLEKEWDTGETFQEIPANLERALELCFVADPNNHSINGPGNGASETRIPMHDDNQFPTRNSDVAISRAGPSEETPLLEPQTDAEGFTGLYNEWRKLVRMDVAERKSLLVSLKKV